MKPTPFGALLFAALVSPIQAQASGLQVADLDRLADVAEPDLSKDGRWLAYSVTRSSPIFGAWPMRAVIRNN
jgi:hypothetical protein